MKVIAFTFVSTVLIYLGRTKQILKVRNFFHKLLTNFSGLDALGKKF